MNMLDISILLNILDISILLNMLDQYPTEHADFHFLSEQAEVK